MASVRLGRDSGKCETATSAYCEGNSGYAPQVRRGLPPAFAAERRFMQQTIVVLKFGSSVLRSAADLPAAVHDIYLWSAIIRRRLPTRSIARRVDE